MAALTPFLPGLPALASPHKGRRRCASTLTQGWTLTPLLPGDPSQDLWDFLTFWYVRVRQDSEHASLWGEIGFSPSRFVLAFTQVPLVLVHQEHLPWHQADGLMMAVWLDDIVPGVRARLHQWVAPPYRHPRVSLVLGRAILRYLFDDFDVQLLEGRTPVGNRLGIRYALRLGFRPVATLPYGEWAWTPDGARTMTPVVQTQLTRDAWRAAQSSAGGLEENRDAFAL
jgi:RimJ/RimL family protein N-acetyltransferase